MTYKSAVKQVLGELPFAPEIYWQLRQSGKPLNRSFSLRKAEKHLPQWRAAVEASLKGSTLPYPFWGKQGNGAHPRRVLLFAELHYWIEHAVLLGMALAGLGQQVTLTYLPYPNWSRPVSRFDLRRHNAYAQSVLDEAAPYLQSASLLNLRTPPTLPGTLSQAVQEISQRDVQYTQQVEEIDLQGELYRLRLERNTHAAGAALTWMQANRPDVVITPNGSILEMGAIYQAARHLGIPAVTYEFGEQRGKIWLAQDGEVMRQETHSLWQARKDLPLYERQWEQVRLLYASRQRGDLWENFSRRWQGLPNQGGEQARAALHLDSRPLALLAANVIGDSLTLGRQVFTPSMTDWLQRTVLYYAGRPDWQLVVRIHPGERYTRGPSVADVVRQVLPQPPGHIHLVAWDDPVNTYDLVEIASLGLVYTTTVGLELAMSGVPVIVAGQTHYRGKGFTLDPANWQEYQGLLDQPQGGRQHPSMSKEQVELAWSYAYRFFFEYPHPFPWHLLGIWDELGSWPLGRVLSSEGLETYGGTFRYLLGEPIDWASPEELP